MSIEEGKELRDKLRDLEKELARDRDIPERVRSAIKSLKDILDIRIAFEEKYGEDLNLISIEEEINRELKRQKKKF